MAKINLGKVVGVDAKINGQTAITLSGANGIAVSTVKDQVTIDGSGVVTDARIQSALGYVPQSKVTGVPGQTIGFDTAGNMVAMDRNYSLFGFELDQTDSNPATCIKYLGDNITYSPAGMNFATGVFDYGNWADAWFIKNIRPVVLNYDGTVAFDLMKDNYQKKVDGTPSGITEDNLAGNVMIGIPTVWYYVDNSVENKPRFWFSDIKVSEKFKAYAHTNNDGEIIPYTYLPAYNGYKDANGKMRSLSGKTISRSLTATAEITAATANNTSGDNIWYTEVLADRMLITLLLFLICRNTNSQAAFGNGNMNGYNHDNGYSSDYGLLPTGTMDDKGLFWGSSEDNLGVKVFGIEHYWGNQWRRTAGYINDKGIQKIKMTYGQQDGSLAEGYNTTGEGYISIGDCPAGSGSFISKMRFNQYGMYPAECSGSATTYYCDGFWSNNSQVNYALFGGGISSIGKEQGINLIAINNKITSMQWYLGASVSCKPHLT